MSKFGKFLDKSGSSSDGSSSTALVTTSGSARASALIDRINREVSSASEAEKIVRGKSTKIAIAMDATGSMASMLRLAKDSIGEIIGRVSREAAAPVEIELFAYRDYDVPQKLLERSGPSADPIPLVRWLGGIAAEGGGSNGGEAIEAALKAILDEDHFAAVLLIGDEPSNGPDDLRAAGRSNTIPAGKLAQTFGAKQVPIHSFAMGHMVATLRDFERLSASSGGKAGRLDGSREVIDLAVMAILSAIKGSASVRAYMERNLLSSNARDFGQLLLGGPK